MYCVNCGNQLTNASKYCTHCGIRTNIIIQHKSSLITLLLCATLGIFGLHRFYIGKVTSAVVMCVFTFTGVLLVVSIIWTIIDLFLIMFNKLNDGYNNELQNNHPKWFIACSVIIASLIIAGFIFLVIITGRLTYYCKSSIISSDTINNLL